MPRALRTGLGVALLAMGAITGFFYAYEVSVTGGLAKVDDDTYVSAMKAINSVVRNGPFALSFFGAIGFTAVALGLAWGVLGPRATAVWLIGAALVVYLIGGFGITMTRSVPLNEDLADVAANASPAELTSARADYEDDWNRWNTVRTIASAAAFGLLATAAVILPARPRRQE
ncbi:anthrone oxygenase family protein [Embleya sp. NPDC001921]